MFFILRMYLVSILCHVQKSTQIMSASRSQVSLLRSVIQNSKVLVVGDGDFSFSKTLINKKEYKSLVTSTLDDEESLLKHFPVASSNIKSILSSSTSFSSARVDYCIDATKIHEVYPKMELFDVIIWNFPHVTGKANIYYNRILLHEFLASARQCLNPYHGLVICALVEGQSGVELNSIDDWSKSWKLPTQAGEAGMRIVYTEPFDLESYQKLGYRHKGHRGFGGGFRVGKSMLYYLSGTPASDTVTATSSTPVSDSLSAKSSTPISDSVSLASDNDQIPTVAESLAILPSIATSIFVHEVHVYLPPDIDLQVYLSSIESTAQDACRVIANAHKLSDKSWSCHLVDLYKCPFKQIVTVAFQIGYSSTTVPLSRGQADSAREVLEVELPKKLGLMPRNEKHGKTVSKGYPHIVASLLKGYSGDGSELLVDITDTDIEARPEGDDEVARLRIIGKDLWKKRAGVIANGFLSDSYSFKDSE